MIYDDWGYTCACIEYLDNKSPGGDRKEIGYLNIYDGAAFDVQLYSSKKDMNGTFICDKDIIYSQLHRTYFNVEFDGCAFRIIDRSGRPAGLLSDLDTAKIIIGGNLYEGIKK